MDVDTFEALPRDERLAYAQYLMDYTVTRNVYNAMYNSQYSSNGDYKITPVPASPDDTGEQIFLNYGYHEQLSRLQLVEDADSPTLDKVKAQEVLSAVYYDVGSNIVSKAYLSDRDYINSGDSNTKKLGVVNIEWTALQTSELLNGHDSQGNKVQYKIVTYRDDSTDPRDPYAGKTAYAEFVYDTFTSYDGSQRSIWLLDMFEGTMDSLKAHSTIK